MTPQMLLLVTLGPALVAGAVAAVALAVAVARDPGRPAGPEWTAAELAAVAAATAAGGELRRPCTMCPARHCAGCEEPARVTATWTWYVARHCWDEVPPSLQRLAGLLPVTLRATVIARKVGPRWHPRPGGGRAGLELWARQVARRHNLRMSLGTFQLQGVLP